MSIRALIAVGLAAGVLITGIAVEVGRDAPAPIGAGATARLVRGGVAHVIDQPTIVASSMLRGPAQIAVAAAQHRATPKTATAGPNVARGPVATPTPTTPSAVPVATTITLPGRTVVTVLPTTDVGTPAAPTATLLPLTTTTPNY